MIIPFIGYQQMNGEKIGFEYHDDYFDYISGTTVEVSDNGSRELDINVPELGISYRYKPHKLFNGELTLSYIMDKEIVEYSAYFEVFGYAVTQRLEVTRKNTLLTNASFIFNFPTKSDRWKPSLKLGGGYATRNITMSGQSQDKVIIPDAENMYVARGALEISFWKNKNFLIDGSIHYTMFIPTDSDLDSFNGIGWRVSIFPMWSLVGR